MTVRRPQSKDARTLDDGGIELADDEEADQTG